MMVQRQSILGVQVSVINMQIALMQIETWLKDRSPNYVCVTPAHSLMECQRDSALREIFNRAGMVTPDGMAVVWLLHLKGHKQVGRVYGPDLLQEACAHGLERGWRHFFLGGEPESLDALVTRLQRQYPGLNVAGKYAPPFRPLSLEEAEGIVSAVNASQADILWIGLGSPRQEIWMWEHLGKLQTPIMVGVGAAFDFLSGKKRQAPKWIQRTGLEWFFRLFTEPRRLWPRYRQYPLFVWLAIRELLRERRIFRTDRQ